ncbi:unnamed protein product [Schistocephalus solidus]|uniref:Uncharacterized protein n=1 Tax=Schistocephalus solidus TaxID=70667 RepID=A0A3P7F0C1_SCHSO|nr:unnamed protein product [Schistocephalus solidus]
MGVATLEDLRARLMHALVVCEVSKTRIMFGRIAGLICSFLFPYCKLTDIGDLGRYLSSEVKAKLIDPDLDDVYNSPIGGCLKDNKAEVIAGLSHVDRLLPTDRSIMNWKKPEARKLLRLSRPISRRVCSEPEDPLTIDKLLLSLPDARCGARVLFISKVDGDFEISGVPQFKKIFLPTAQLSPKVHFRGSIGIPKLTSVRQMRADEIFFCPQLTLLTHDLGQVPACLNHSLRGNICGKG